MTAGCSSTCIYYGSKQAFAGPEPSERQFLPDGSRDVYRRDANVRSRRSSSAGTGQVPMQQHSDIR